MANRPPCAVRTEVPALGLRWLKAYRFFGRACPAPTAPSRTSAEIDASRLYNQPRPDFDPSWRTGSRTI